MEIKIPEWAEKAMLFHILLMTFGFGFGVGSVISYYLIQ